MPPAALVIDGHNLIGKLPGFSLSEIDDEQRLVELLHVYARTRRKRIEVYFDGAPPGQAGARAAGILQVVFVPLGKSADAAIRERLTALGKQARNISVVTSDRQVQAEARSRGAEVIPSESFGRDLLASTQAAASAKDPAHAGRAVAQRGRAINEAGPPVPDHEVQEWLEIFEKAKKKK